MRLRELRTDDAPLMLEWMHDKLVTCFLRTDFASKSLDDCIDFISNAVNDENINLAVVDENDEYMGTVSLKNIYHNSAELAITMRSKAMGKGIASDAMKEIIRIAFEQENIKYVYWCVSPENKRAVKFYEKNGYVRDDAAKKMIRGKYSEEEISRYIWYLKREEGVREWKK